MRRSFLIVPTTLAKDPKDRNAKAAIGRHRELLKSLDSRRKKWDVVVLQSYRDGGPITRTFSAKDRADLQRIAWEGFKQFEEIAAPAGHNSEGGRK